MKMFPKDKWTAKLKVLAPFNKLVLQTFEKTYGGLHPPPSPLSVVRRRVKSLLDHESIYIMQIFKLHVEFSETVNCISSFAQHTAKSFWWGCATHINRRLAQWRHFALFCVIWPIIIEETENRSLLITNQGTRLIKRMEKINTDHKRKTLKI